MTAAAPAMRDVEVPPAGAMTGAADVAELTLLVRRSDLSGLERAAAAEGVTVARLLRRAVREYLARESRPGATGCRRCQPGDGHPSEREGRR